MASPSLGVAHPPPFRFAHFDSLQKGRGTFCFAEFDTFVENSLDFENLTMLQIIF
jgi:hypothetical protein